MSLLIICRDLSEGPVSLPSILATYECTVRDRCLVARSGRTNMDPQWKEQQGEGSRDQGGADGWQWGVLHLNSQVRHTYVCRRIMHGNGRMERERSRPAVNVGKSETESASPTGKPRWNSFEGITTVGCTHVRDEAQEEGRRGGAVEGRLQRQDSSPFPSSRYTTSRSHGIQGKHKERQKRLGEYLTLLRFRTVPLLR